MNKKIFAFALVVFLTPQVSASNWTLLGKNETVELFIDLDSIKEESGSTKVNSYRNFLQSPNSNYKSWENEFSISCQENSYIESNPIIYSEYNRIGPVARGTVSQEKKNIENPNSFAGVISRKICSNKTLSVTATEKIPPQPNPTYSNNITAPTLKNLRQFLDRDINWIHVADNSEKFPVHIAKDEIYLNQQGDIYINAMIQYREHVNGGISSIFSLKINNCFNEPFPSWTRFRNRYYSEINGRGVVLFDKTINEEVIYIDSNNIHSLWSKVALAACSLAKKTPHDQLLKYEDVNQILSFLSSPSGSEFYKKFQIEDEKKFKNVRLAKEKTRIADLQKRYSTKEGVLDMRNRSSMAGSCFAILQSSQNFDEANKANKWASIDGLRFTEGMGKGFEGYREAPRNILQAALNYCLTVFR